MKPDWQPIETIPGPDGHKQIPVLLWWVGAHDRENRDALPDGASIGSRQWDHDTQEWRIWTGTQFLKMEFFTHWAPLPEGP